MATQVTLNSGSVDSAGSLALKTNGTTTAVTINTSQGVEFNAGTAAAPSITTTGDTNTGIFFPAADTIAFSEGGVEAMRIDSSGNVGIGTGSPATQGRLVVKSSGVLSSSGLAVQASANDSFLSVYNTGSVHNIEATYNSTGSYQPIAFITGGSERARIDSSGNLLVGTTSVIQSGKYSCSFAGNVSNGIVLQTTFASTGTDFVRCVNSAGTAIGNITQNGATTVAYNTSSDYRLKHDITPMTGALAKVAALKPCTYKWNADNSDGEGFIAHELQAVVPDCVSGEKDAVDAEGNPQYQGIDTSFLVATLTAAIQEQQALITQLQADVAALKGTA